MVPQVRVVLVSLFVEDPARKAHGLVEPKNCHSISVPFVRIYESPFAVESTRVAELDNIVKLR